MKFSTAIRENLGFLIVELSSQLERLRDFFAGEDTAQAILDRRGYIINLSQRVQAAGEKMVTAQNDFSPLTLRCIGSIATGLERIAELCCSCVKQLNKKHNQNIDLVRFSPMLKRISKSLKLVEKALLKTDSELAVRIGRTHYDIEVNDE